MSRPPILIPVALAALGAGALAGNAVAQTAGQTVGQTSGHTSGQTPGSRSLSWQARIEASRTATQPVAARAGRRPNPVIPHGSMAAATPPRPGLTPAPGGTPVPLKPANAWMRPAAVVQAAPIAAPMAVVEPPPSTVIQPPPTGYARAAPSTPDAVADPIAPRRDAPVFRMQKDARQPVAGQETAEVAARAEPTRPEPIRMAVARNTADRPPQQGARYYSVHLQNGRRPDAMVMPQPTCVDDLTLTLPETPASQDLAQPDQATTLIRDTQDRMRAAPAASDGDHQ